MKKIVLLSTIFLVMVTVGCAQEKEQKNGHGETQSEETPKGNWTVHKEYDKNGNLIRKDSTYSYGSINGKEISKGDMDKIMEHFRDKMGDLEMADFPEGFDLDSLRNRFFEHDFGRNMGDMGEKMQRRMDSLRKQFFDRAPQHKQIPGEKEQKQDRDSLEQDDSYYKI